MKIPLNRREFLAGSLATAACLSAQEAPHWNFPTEARKRLSVSSYPFRSLIARTSSSGSEAPQNGMSLEQFAQTTVPKLGVPGIEPWSHHFQSLDAEYVRGLRQAFTKAGLHVVNIPVDITVTLCGTAAERQAGIAEYRKWVDAAVLLHSPSIRVHLPASKGSDSIECAADSMKELANYGESKGIVINVENDDPQCEKPARIVQVLKAVNSLFLRALPDFCNSMLIFNNEQENEAALRKLFPLAFNISHVKDSERDEGKVYRVNMARIFSIAKQARYAGYFSMEWEGQGDPLKGMQKLIEASLQDLS